MTRNIVVSEHGSPDAVILHISDTHLVGDETEGLYGSPVQPGNNVELLFERVSSSGVRPDVIVFTGDLADKGEPAAYDRLKHTVDEFTDRVGCPVVWVAGNHDSREVMREHIQGVPGVGGDVVDYVQVVNPALRIIVLDTTVPGEHYGFLDANQLSWLSNVLGDGFVGQTFIALHHPPVPCVQPLAVSVELRGQREFEAILLAHPGVVAGILGGHLHYSTSSMFAGVPVSVASATCYTQDLVASVGCTRGRDGGQGFNFVHIFGDVVVHSVVPLVEGVTVGEFVDADTVQSRLAENGHVIS